MPEQQGGLALSKQITQARESKGMSRSELARRIGVEPSLVSKWESGTRNVTAERVGQINRVLQASLVAPPASTRKTAAKKTTAKKTTAKKTTAKKTAARKSPTKRAVAKKTAAKKTTAKKTTAKKAAVRKSSTKRVAAKKTAAKKATARATPTPARRRSGPPVLLVELDNGAVRVFDRAGNEVEAVVLNLDALTSTPAAQRIALLGNAMRDAADLPPELYRRAGAVLARQR